MRGQVDSVTECFTKSQEIRKKTTPLGTVLHKLRLEPTFSLA